MTINEFQKVLPLLYEHKEAVFADHRMFLARTPLLLHQTQQIPLGVLLMCYQVPPTNDLKADKPCYKKLRRLMLEHFPIDDAYTIEDVVSICQT